jgi:hypothetical protein
MKTMTNWDEVLCEDGLSMDAGLQHHVRYAGTIDKLATLEKMQFDERLNNDGGRRVGFKKTFIGYCNSVDSFPASYVYRMLNGFDPDTAHIPQPKSDFNQVTPEDVDWADRQKAFPHTLAMPRFLRNFCPSCREQVTAKEKVITTRRGVYLPVEHDCARVRVYDLRGNLLEVKQL